MHKLMLVDDEPNVLRALHRLLAKAGYELEEYTDPEAALKRAATATFDLILSDYRMPQLDGIELLKRLRTMQPDAVRLVLSGYADLDGLQAAINEAEIYRFINKPWYDQELLRTIELALAHRDTVVENRRLAEALRKQQRILASLEELHPGITRVDWETDGSIRLSEEDA